MMNNRLFIFTIPSLILLAFSVLRLRKPRNTAYLNAVLWPLNDLRERFDAFRLISDYKVSHDSRKISIEKVLNDYFDPGERRIYIDNVAPRQPVYLYEPNDERPVHLYEPAENRPVYLHDDFSGNVNGANFIVVLPLDIQPQEERARQVLETKINAQIDYYKLYSKNHALLWTEL